MVGDSTDAVWVVVDTYSRTNFPDIRKKAILHSNVGNLLLIPREGGSLIRFYIELPYRTFAKTVSLEGLHHTARQIFQPYTLDIGDTFLVVSVLHWTVPCRSLFQDNRVFLTENACHTHSPKAGQGTNVSFQDGYNIGWKLAALLEGQAGPELLRTYNIEREKVAADLTDFDRSSTKLFPLKVDNLDSTTILQRAIYSESTIHCRLNGKIQ
jgi:phenol 2-monooxygenase (NADPH)